MSKKLRLWLIGGVIVVIVISVTIVAYLLSQVGDSVPEIELVVAQIVDEHGFELQESSADSDYGFESDGYTNGYVRSEMTAEESEEILALLDSVSTSWQYASSFSDGDEVLSTNGDEPEQEFHSYFLIERRTIWIMYTPSEKDYEQPDNKPEAKLFIMITGELGLWERITELFAPTKIEN